jgi:hypothetical protein
MLATKRSADEPAPRPKGLGEVGETLGSNRPPAVATASPRGLALYLVVILVSMAFAAGVLVGWVLGHTR